MTGKRFWMVCTFVGGLLFVGGLIATIIIGIETGEERPDSECSTTMSAASVPAITCITSSDPKLLLGMGPMFAGMAMAGVGIWRWIAAAASDPDSPSDPSGDGDSKTSLFEALQQQAMEQMGAAGVTGAAGATTGAAMTAGTTPAAPPTGEDAPGWAAPTPPSPPAPPGPGE